MGLALCILIIGACGSEAAIRVSHSPPTHATACRSVRLDVLLAGDVRPESILSADIVVLADSREEVLPLVLDRNVLTGEIPADLVSVPEVSYYIRIDEVAGETTVCPPGAPRGGIFSVPVAHGSHAPPCDRGAAPRLEMVAPSPGEPVTEGPLQIAVIIDPPLAGSWSALLLLDGEDVTVEADESAGYIVLERTSALEPGEHTVTVVVMDDAGQFEAEWSFISVSGAERLRPAVGGRASPPGLEAHGRLEIGWAAAAADTTKGDSLDVYLPYEETSMPTLDFYASSVEAGRTILMSASFDPIYYERLQWACSLETERFDAEAGDIYPSLSRTTLDWTSGLGGRAAVRAGRADAEVVAVRVAESDTLGGFGVYSRYVLAGAGRLNVGSSVVASLILSRGFDDEGSVPEAARIDDPLINDVLAGVAAFSRGRASLAVEAARSSSAGQLEGDGNAVRIGAAYEKDFRNRISLDYLYSDPTFYSVGSLETRPGERGMELEFTFAPCAVCWATGSAGAYRTYGSSQSIDQNETSVKLYGRIDGAWPLAAGSLRTYLVARHDRTPYETYDYEYLYGGAGATYARGPFRSTAGYTWSRSRSTDTRTLAGVSLDLRCAPSPRRWSLRWAGNWSLAEDGGAADYERSTYTLEGRVYFGDADLRAEYRRIEREDRLEPEQSYTEHIFRIRLGQAF